MDKPAGTAEALRLADAIECSRGGPECKCDRNRAAELLREHAAEIERLRAIAAAYRGAREANGALLRKVCSAAGITEMTLDRPLAVAEAAQRVIGAEAILATLLAPPQAIPEGGR